MSKAIIDDLTGGFAQGGSRKACTAGCRGILRGGRSDQRKLPATGMQIPASGSAACRRTPTPLFI
ncbi:MAG: hypothetical protein U9Q98_00095 [Bacteroidota bacterium]|nr:hypothetical protein [Bacteroidota bacterium]